MSTRARGTGRAARGAMRSSPFLTACAALVTIASCGSEIPPRTSPLLVRAPLPLPHVRRLEDQGGAIYANTASGVRGVDGHFAVADDEGLAVWDGTHAIGLSGPITPDPPAELLVQGLDVRSIRALPDGVVWLCDDDRVWRWDGAAWETWGVTDFVWITYHLGCEGIEAASGDDAWLIGPFDGDASYLWHFDGRLWQPLGEWPPNVEDLTLVEDRMYGIVWGGTTADGRSHLDVWTSDLVGGAAYPVGIDATHIPDLRREPGTRRLYVPARVTVDPLRLDVAMTYVVDGDVVVDRIESAGYPIPAGPDDVYFVEGTSENELVVTHWDGAAMAELAHIRFYTDLFGSYGGYGILIDGVPYIDGPFGWLTLP